MHAQIMDFSSQTFYGGTLMAHATVQSHLLCGLAGVQATPLTETAMHWIDTAGADYQEALEADGESRTNIGEATLVQRLAAHFTVADGAERVHPAAQILVTGVDSLNLAPSGKLDAWRRQVNCLFGLYVSKRQRRNSKNSYLQARLNNGDQSV